MLSVPSGTSFSVQHMEHHPGVRGCLCRGGTADLNVVFLHPSHVFDIEQMAFVEVQQHQMLLVCPPQIPLLQECHKLLAILCKHLSINVSRLCGLDGVSRRGCFSPLVLQPCCLEKNHGGYHHAPSTDVCNHCAGFSFFTRYGLESSLSFDPNTLL